MTMDQCHSTVGELPSALSQPRAASHREVGVTGRKYWRSLDDLADTPDFREWLERELPAGASRLLDSSRRTFMRLMGASVALAGAATLPGCRRPDHKILTYSREVPEDIIPGKPLYYATTLPMPGGEAEGVLVETHEGRPTKIEGNPLHPINNGKSSLWSQASILSLYDPDRLKDPVLTTAGETARSWDDVAAWSKVHFDALAAKQGEGLCFLVDKRQSVSRDAVRAMVLKRFPKAKWFAYDPIQADEMFAGLSAAAGKPCREVFALQNADVIVSLDADLLAHDAGCLPNARGFASRRRVEEISPTADMSRLYMVESSMSITGGRADHRMRLAPSQIPAFAAALAKELMTLGALKASPALAAAINGLIVPAGVVDAAFVDAVAKDVAKDAAGKARTGRTLICAGPTQPAAVHALCAALNAGLGNVGQTVRYAEVSTEFASSSGQAITALAAELHAGRVDTLVTIGVNPVYDAPGELDFAGGFAKATHRITACVDDNETVALSTWRLPMAHWLECWGDAISSDGTIGPIQPMIAPLYGAKSDLEILATIAGAQNPQGYDLVRAAWADRAKSPGGTAGAEAEKSWKRALHDGVLARGTAGPAVDGAAISERAAPLVAAMKPSAGPLEDEFDLVFVPGNLSDGRFANNPWLQELPEVTTRIAWDNVAMISPASAAKYGLEQEKATSEHRSARMITITVGDRSISLPAWVTPGIPENTAVLAFGYGRTVCGHVGNDVGFNVFPIAAPGNVRVRTGARIQRASTGRLSHDISCTQTHGSMEGRAIVRDVDLPAWRNFAADPLARMSEDERQRVLKDSYGNERRLDYGNTAGRLNLAEMLGELSHAPANINAYVNPQRGTKGLETAPPGVHGSTSTGKPPQADTSVDYSKGPQFSMTIDLATCTGCNVCTIACQAENNIPVVGKAEVNKGREMHWIRVDRYFAGDPSDPTIAYQPVACVQCENAPCETVCPVNATVHGPEGINYMVYNRCIGTRYCANNCPYKVRRFNFFEYGTRKLNGSFIGKDALDEVGVGGPANVNLIPPRLREKIDTISQLQKNPDVTVRSRGVMEKCTYCIQRINEARIEVKLQNLKAIPDGFFQAACQQACPSDAITFGDMLDPSSRLSKARATARSYALLGFLNTRPRTLYLAGVRNPNPALVDAERKHLWEHPFHHGDHGHDHEHGHGHEGGHDHGKAEPHASHDRRTTHDPGHRFSLAILNA